ncbi:DUF3114 domain-containing protein [Streptococcus sp. NLN64]|uniref:DUF3114 domain-containing protein n=1 Tax=Streptococcus sp. NLN64 TaxID=2822799 RepID=UPI0018CA2A12|nr:DUF3114 domain-containing protein [Streptococcus sp. NLN64]MBG9366685.1 DUF3114 domain-containing protein [Streptococcus sp. NLN64]
MNQFLNGFIGSPHFRAEWTQKRQLLTPLELLTWIMSLLQMPADLTEDPLELQRLLACFDPDLAPHDRFWKDLVKLVQQAFPKNTLDQPGLLNRQVHQLRYLISIQQAQYIRNHFRESGMTDREALARYLKGRYYTLWDRGRLHQKLSLVEGRRVYPDNQASVNLKVLYHQRVELILDSQGRFLNILDLEGMSEAGTINGASFNYGGFFRHRDLDIAPIGRHDPRFRRKKLKGFRSPTKARWSPDDRSFWSSHGPYAQSGHSLASLLKRSARDFRRLVRKS